MPGVLGHRRQAQPQRPGSLDGNLHELRTRLRHHVQQAHHAATLRRLREREADDEAASATKVADEETTMTTTKTRIVAGQSVLGQMGAPDPLLSPIYLPADVRTVLP